MRIPILLPRRLMLLLATAVGLLVGGCATTSDSVVYESYGYGVYYGGPWDDPWHWHPDYPDFIGPPIPPPCDKPPCHRPPPCDNPPCHRPPGDKPPLCENPPCHRPPGDRPPGDRPPVDRPPSNTRPPPGMGGNRPTQLPTRPVRPSRPMPPPRPSPRGGGRAR